jgi:adenylate kinase family enzyme
MSQQFGIPHIQLDALSWGKNWIERDHEEFLNLLKETIDGQSSWIIDGNYSRSHWISWPSADVFIWLNYSFPVVMARALKRTFRRAWTQEALFSGNRESFRRSLMSRDSILLWVLHTHRSHRMKYSRLMEEQRARGKQVIVLKRPEEVNHLADRLTALGIQSPG